MKKRLIWTSEPFDFIGDEGFEADLAEAYSLGGLELGEDADETRYNYARDCVEQSFEDERLNLAVIPKHTSGILCVATLQLWNGARSAYKLLRGTQVSACLEEVGQETIRFYQEDSNLVAYETGHDNPVSPSVFVFYGIRDDVEDKHEDEFDELIDSIYDNNGAKEAVKEALRKKILIPLGPTIDKIYGEIPEENATA